MLDTDQIVQFQGQARLLESPGVFYIAAISNGFVQTTLARRLIFTFVENGRY